MGLFFHKHQFSTFTCTANEIPGISFSECKGIHDKVKYPIKTSGYCTKCGKNLDSNGKCSQYSGCQTQHVIRPDLKDIIISYKKCQTCDHYEISALGNMYSYIVNKEYIKLRLDDIKKKKDDEETERLLNLGNPDYINLKSKETTEKILDTQKQNEEYKKTISALQTKLRNVVGLFNEASKIAAIWEVLPAKSKKLIMDQYGKKAKSPEPLDAKEIIETKLME